MPPSEMISISDLVGLGRHVCLIFAESERNLSEAPIGGTQRTAGRQIKLPEDARRRLIIAKPTATIVECNNFGVAGRAHILMSL